MKFTKRNGLEFAQFESFPEKSVSHGFFTRKGGVSPSPWNSLNLGGTVGDSRENVVENRKRIFSCLNRQVESLYDVWQVHSAEVICTNEPRPLDQALIQADAIITASPDVTLFMRFADCVPIVLFDPIKKVVGLVHSGWVGTVKKISAAAIQKMEAEYNCRPENILAGIGPSIGPDQYEIGADVVEKVSETFGNEAKEVLIAKDGRSFLDLWTLNQLILTQAGVKSIELAGISTADDLERWYSHRWEHGKTGRFAALINLVADNE